MSIDMTEFLKYTRTNSVVSAFYGDPYHSTHTDGLIASGQLTHKLVYEEEVYEGDSNVVDVIKWLQQFDNTWRVGVSQYDGEIVVCKETEVPYTEEEIEAAKQRLQDKEEDVVNYIKWRHPPYLHPEWFKEEL